MKNSMLSSGHILDDANSPIYPETVEAARRCLERYGALDLAPMVLGEAAA